MLRPKVVIGLDFGTTHSGFAFAHRTDPENIHLFTDWPGAPRSYCKTQTSLFYVPREEDGSLKLKDWSWNALNKFMVATRAFRSGRASPLPEEIDRRVGVFVTSFKLLLEQDSAKFNSFQGKLDVERLVVDYLRSMSDFISRHLKEKYGKDFSMRDVQWCLTVPAIWSDKAKQKMKVYAEKAGLVQGKFCGSPDASVSPLWIVLEPEAASLICQKQIVSSFSAGDRFLVADVGGGTIDIVVHEHDRGGVHEVACSGALGGGTYVDANFMEFLTTRIGCFTVFQQQKPEVVQRILRWWLGPQGKATFDGTGSKFLEVPRKLSKAWKLHDMTKLGLVQNDDYYNEIKISSEQMCAMFDTEIDKTITLIQEILNKAEIKYIFLVGGFSENSYFSARMKQHFSSLVSEVLLPPNPAAAICRGAVALGMGRGVVLSRISRQTYGLSFSCPFEDFDPPEYMFIDSLGQAKCANAFQVYVQKHASVPESHSVTHSYFPSFLNQKKLKFSLLGCSTDAIPMYTTHDDLQLLYEFEIDMSEDVHLGMLRQVDVTMCFGKTSVEISSRRVNFGVNREPETLYSMEFEGAYIISTAPLPADPEPLPVGTPPRAAQVGDGILKRCLHKIISWCKN